MNWIPGVSQVKSAFQLVCGDAEGAAQTQRDFLQECPLVSQVTSTVQLIAGDADGALETQKKCGNMLMRTADGIPVVGHAKGVVHYICGDEEGGNHAMKSASRTTAAMAGGAGGFIAGGPLGAVAGGIAGGATFDSAVTAVDSVVHDEYRPSGYYAAVDNLIKNPNAGDIFDTAMMPVGDGLAGYSGGRLVSRFRTTPNPAGQGGPPPSADALARANALESQAHAVLDAAENGRPHMPSGEYLRMSNEAQGLWNQAQSLKQSQVPTVDMKAQPAASVRPGVILTNAEASPTTSKSKDEELIPKHELIEMWVVWESDAIAIVGSEKWIPELVSAYLHIDIPVIKSICTGHGLATIELFGDLSTLTYRKVVEVALESGAIKVNKKADELIELLRKTGKKGKQAVKRYFSSLTQQAGELKEKDKRAKRGEHVINNGVLTLHQEILNRFLSEAGITTDGYGGLSLMEGSRILQDCQLFFAPLVKADIQRNLIVYFGEDETYIDANALLYGRSIELLRRQAVQHMVELYRQPNRGSGQAQPLRETIHQINSGLLYVDQNALMKWRRENGGRGEATYERARAKVYEMFDGLYEKIGWWISELRRNSR